MAQNDKFSLWTIEEDEELVELVMEQTITLVVDPELCWLRISVQLDKTPSQCKERWGVLGKHKRKQAVRPWYEGGGF